MADKVHHVIDDSKEEESQCSGQLCDDSKAGYECNYLFAFIGLSMITSFINCIRSRKENCSTKLVCVTAMYV